MTFLKKELILLNSIDFPYPEDFNINKIHYLTKRAESLGVKRFFSSLNLPPLTLSNSFP